MRTLMTKLEHLKADLGAAYITADTTRAEAARADVAALADAGADADTTRTAWETRTAAWMAYRTARTLVADCAAAYRSGLNETETTYDQKGETR